jgi:hypothetical protein
MPQMCYKIKIKRGKQNMKNRGNDFAVVKDSKQNPSATKVQHINN